MLIFRVTGVLLTRSGLNPSNRGLEPGPCCALRLRAPLHFLIGIESSIECCMALCNTAEKRADKNRRELHLGQLRDERLALCGLCDSQSSLQALEDVVIEGTTLAWRDRG